MNQILQRVNIALTISIFFGSDYFSSTNFVFSQMINHKANQMVQNLTEHEPSSQLD
jgi:hypothetical protein